MTAAVFVDTAAWYALTDRDDPQHARAERYFQRLVMQHLPLITTNYIVGETYTLCRSRLGAAPAQQFFRRMRRSADVQRFFFPEAWESAVEDLLAQYDDQPFSYVDATSFVAMRRLRLREAFTFDRHFATAGFVLMPEQ